MMLTLVVSKERWRKEGRGRVLLARFGREEEESGALVEMLTLQISPVREEKDQVELAVFGWAGSVGIRWVCFFLHLLFLFFP
jgi:hypothetical protein